MQRVEEIEEILEVFAFDKTSFPIVQIDGDKGKTGFPFIIKPAASSDQLVHGVVAEHIHEQDKDKASPPIIRLEKIGCRKQRQEAEKLYHAFIPEILQSPAAKEPQEQSEIHILFLIEQGSRVPVIPDRFGDQGEDQKISDI